MLFERIDGLPHERTAIGEKKHTFDPIRAHEQIAERDRRAGLPRSRRHDEQRFAKAVAVEALNDLPDRAMLVVPLNDLFIDLERRRRPPSQASLNGELQLVSFVEPLDATGRRLTVVPDPMFVAVSIEDHWALPVMGF